MGDGFNFIFFAGFIDHGFVCGFNVSDGDGNFNNELLRFNNKLSSTLPLYGDQSVNNGVLARFTFGEFHGESSGSDEF